LLCISAALLGYELLLMRLLALAYWGHFAGMVISIAMLGIASSGLFLFFARERLKRAPEKFFVVSAGLFGVAAPLAFILSQRLPFTPFLLTWSAHEYSLLAGRSLLFFSAFFGAGIAIGVPFVARVLPMGRLYFWNMLGSGLPALPLLLAMNFAHPMRLLIAVTVVAVAVPVFARGNKLVRGGWMVLAVVVISVIVVTPFRYSEYKDLPKTLLLPDSRLIEERYRWDGIVQIVESPHTRYVPGLSLNFAGVVPPRGSSSRTPAR
jgi:MFS family permease